MILGRGRPLTFSEMPGTEAPLVCGPAGGPDGDRVCTLDEITARHIRLVLEMTGGAHRGRGRGRGNAGDKPGHPAPSAAKTGHSLRPKGKGLQHHPPNLPLRPSGPGRGAADGRANLVPGRPRGGLPVFFNRAGPGRRSLTGGGVRQSSFGFFKTAGARCWASTPTSSNMWPSGKGWQYEYLHGSWAECLAWLESGRIDLLTAIAYSRQRAEKFEFNRETVLTNYGLVYVPESVSVQSVLDLDGKRVAALKGDIHYLALLNLTEQFQVSCRFVEAPSYAEVPVRGRGRPGGRGAWSTGSGDSNGNGCTGWSRAPLSSTPSNSGSRPARRPAAGLWPPWTAAWLNSRPPRVRPTTAPWTGGWKWTTSRPRFRPGFAGDWPGQGLCWSFFWSSTFSSGIRWLRKPRPWPRRAKSLRAEIQERLRTEEALIVSEKRFADIAANTSDWPVGSGRPGMLHLRQRRGRAGFGVQPGRNDRAALFQHIP